MRGLENRNIPIVGARNNTLVVEPNAAYKFIMTFQNTEADASLNVPDADCEVGGAGDNVGRAVL